MAQSFDNSFVLYAPRQGCCVKMDVGVHTGYVFSTNILPKHTLMNKQEKYTKVDNIIAIIILYGGGVYVCVSVRVCVYVCVCVCMCVCVCACICAC